MNTSSPKKPDASLPTRTARSGRYFTIDLPTVSALIERGISYQELLAYFVMAAGTDASNTLTRSGRKAIAIALNESRYAAPKTVNRLLELGAIESLEADLINRRDPTAARFRLPLAGAISIGSADVLEVGAARTVARLPNSLVQDPIQVANLRRAVSVGGMPALTTLLQIATDPLQTIWPPTVYADVEMEAVGRLGSKVLARLDLTFGMPKATRICFPKAPEAVLILAEFGIVCLDIYMANPTENGDLAMLDPVATVWRGAVGLNTAFGKAAIFALLADRLVRSPLEPLPEGSTLLAEFRQSEKVIALLPSNVPNVRVIIRPRLFTPPRDPETVDAEHRLIVAGAVAAADIRELIKQNFPSLAAYVTALTKAPPS